VGFIPTFAAAHPVLHHAMVQNREIPQARGVALSNATPRFWLLRAKIANFGRRL